MKVKFIAIAAMGRKREIGLKGKLPWNIPEEYKAFKEAIEGQYVLIGRKNFESHNKNLGNAKPLVLSRTHPEYFKDMAQIIQHAEQNDIETIYVMGGAEIYELSLPFLSEFLCSVVDYEGPADAYFPEYMSYEWEVLREEIHDEWTLYHMKKRPDY